eukprot:Rhum_TRINITY_DN14408_c17_g2::Rhum_TRINITY_DN14408_c17_g2_i1::g.88651::m.88651
MSSFTHERLSPRVWKVVQDDPFRQYPFLYCIKADDRVILIDTGCPVKEGGRTYKSYLDEHVNPESLPYLVLCTHIHFDHIGGNCEFCRGGPGGVAGSEVWMSGASRAFTENYATTSLAAAHGVEVAPFTVSRWLEDGERIVVSSAAAAAAGSGGSGGNDEEYLEVLHTPGHTPDSVALYYPAADRIFIGDSLYPYTAIHLDCLGSDLAAYEATLRKLAGVVERETGTSPLAGAAGTQQGAPAQALPAPCAAFLETLGLTEEAVSRQFCVRSLLAVCMDDAEAAVGMYLTNMDDVRELCPPGTYEESAEHGDGGDSGGGSGGGDVSAAGAKKAKLVLSCGHVEADLSTDAIGQVAALVRQAKSGALPPLSLDDGYGEYTDGTFTVVLKCA